MFLLILIVIIELIETSVFVVRRVMLKVSL